GPADTQMIAALHPATAAVERDDQPIPAAMIDDERRLDRIAAAFALTGGTACDRADLGAGRRLAGPRVEPHQLDAVPEAAKGQPLPTLPIASKGRVDRVEGTALLRGDDHPLIPPAIMRAGRVERRGGGQADDRALFPEGRHGVIEPVAAAGPRNIG